MREFVNQEHRVLARRSMIDPGVRNVEIEDRRDRVEHYDHQDRRFRPGVDAGIEAGNIECKQLLRYRVAHQHAAQQRAENDRRNRQSLNPAIGHDQLVMRQVLGEDAVLGR